MPKRKWCYSLTKVFFDDDCSLVVYMLEDVRSIGESFNESSKSFEKTTSIEKHEVWSHWNHLMHTPILSAWRGKYVTEV